jgi:chemotaxis protein histidine kinase CheA
MHADKAFVRRALASVLAAGLLSAPLLAQGRQTQSAPQPSRSHAAPSQRPDTGRRIDEQRMASARRSAEAAAQDQRAQQAREQQQQRAQNARQNQQAEAQRAQNAREQQQRAENARQQENAASPRAAQARSSSESKALARQVYARVNSHRSRLARIDRLIELFGEKQDSSRLAQLEQMRQRETAAFDQEMTRMREQLGPDMYGRVRAALEESPAGNRGTREASSPTETTRQQRGGTPPPAETPKPRGGGL